MKRILLVLMALTLLLGACGFAEGEANLEEQALNVVSIINSFTSGMETLNSEQIFSGFQVVVEGEIFGFGNSENSMTALVVGNPETNKLSSFSLFCDVEKGFEPVLRCCSVLPMAHMINDGNEANEDAIFADMDEMGAFFDFNYDAAFAALQNGEDFFAAYSDSDYFCIEWSVTPMENGARMMLSYYFEPAAAE